MASPSLVTPILELAERLGKVLECLPTENPFEPSPGKTDAQSFLFEMVALVDLLAGLYAAGWSVSEAAPKQEPMKFLRAPGKKAGTTYFRVRKGEAAAQVVHGSELRDTFGSTQAPDISIQRDAAGVDPSFEDLLAMWDMKLKGGSIGPSETRLDKADVAIFSWMARQLALQAPGFADNILDDFPAAFSVSALLTNGEQPTVTAASLAEEGFSCVAPYQEAASVPTPTRAEHLLVSAGLKRSPDASAPAAPPRVPSGS